MVCGLGLWHVPVFVGLEKWTVQGNYQSSWSTCCRPEEKEQSAPERAQKKLGCHCDWQRYQWFDSSGNFSQTRKESPGVEARQAGFHYVGRLHENRLLRTALALITDGQVRFAEQGSVVIGKKTRCKIKYTIYNGKKQTEAHLKKQFPSDAKAVEFFKIMKICSKKIHLLCMLKMGPLWFASFILWSGIADLISPIRYSCTNTTDIVNTLTSCDLLTVFLSNILW
ncbi:inactive all-trans-retinol 13,14-reductase-like [Chanodichthys erythropterus]|uniref:inactive all-trans-retinol 13,14-reductase-like n=1 Tax=Chanodichthys erythropterus TaxID=933992 RepID=UPI00351E52F7